MGLWSRIKEAGALAREMENDPVTDATMRENALLLASFCAWAKVRHLCDGPSCRSSNAGPLGMDSFQDATAGLSTMSVSSRPHLLMVSLRAFCGSRCPLVSAADRSWIVRADRDPRSRPLNLEPLRWDSEGDIGRTAPT